MATLNRITVTIIDDGSGTIAVKMDVEVGMPVGAYRGELTLHVPSNPGDDLTLSATQAAAISAITAAIRAAAAAQVRSDLVLP